MALNYICVFCGQKSGMPSSRCCNSQNGRFFNANRCQFIANNPAQKDFSVASAASAFPLFWPWSTRRVRKARASVAYRSKPNFEIALRNHAFLKFFCKKTVCRAV